VEGIEADIELIDLILKIKKIADMGDVLLSFCHIGVFRALANAAHLNDQQSATHLSSMQDKDSEAVSQMVKEWKQDGM
ncbi:ATP phosphoribosyltransferase regulatory subunit, partial [Neisseria sp. P0009.S004]|uniref:ATP phosphoribosyltransferase regulatory subunit n=1 Tax=Neisseria sp. P0009.S004 TaxID=3436711 RepID=UPI003F806C95